MRRTHDRRMPISRPSILTRIAAATVGVITALAVALCAPGQASAADNYPTAVTVGSIPTVGPLFFDGISSAHGCTASVVAAPGQDLILTAAHCISGTGAGVLFAPGYLNGKTPYGVWTVTKAFIDAAWKTRLDPQHDYAILEVAAQVRSGHLTKLQAVTGANVLSLAPRAGTRVTVPAYAAGIDDAPVSCTTASYLQSGYPAFNCHGYPGGTSGSPFLVATGNPNVKVVAGLIGGLHQGGCFEYTSYSPAFRSDVLLLWLRASFGSTPDVVPTPSSDGC